MKIDRQNYELFAIDFLDGKMTPPETAAFMAFLTENPDIAQEIELLRDIDTEIAPKPESRDFSYLMKNINQAKVTPENFEEHCIAYYEGDLDRKAQNKLFGYIAQDNLHRQKFEMYGKLKISPDKSIVFSGKNQLKHRTILPVNARRIALITSFAAAASLALVFIFKTPQVEQVDMNVAQTNNSNTTKTEIHTTIVSDNAKATAEARNTKIRQTKKDVKNEQKAEAQIELPSNDRQNIRIAAVVDSIQDETIRISLISPKPLENELDLEPNKLAFLRDIPVQSYKNKEKLTPGIEEIKDRTTGLVALASGLTIDDLINSGVKGLNKMVEGNLSYQSKRDGNGKMTEFALSSDAFKYKRKIKNN